MTPIEGVSRLRRMPRLGKIRLGIKVEAPGDLFPEQKVVEAEAILREKEAK